MPAEERPTLLRPPEPDPEKAPIENVLEVTELAVFGPDIFTNTRQPWHPPGARGIFGGAVIAQCLVAGQRTVPDDFLPHSCHCYFLLAGSSTVPILFHVERVRDGRSFATRTVQARQKGRCIFTTTISFAREAPAGEEQVQHAAPLPADADPPPSDDWEGESDWSRGDPFQSHRMQIVGDGDGATELHERKVRRWVRARGQISRAGGHRAHLNALAYMSDIFLINTVARIHELWRFPFEPEDVPKLPEQQRRKIQKYHEMQGFASRIEDWRGRGRLGMIVSLDHSIYFHEPRQVQADDWLFTEMNSPWAGGGRGVVMSRIFAKDGTLLASCIQEGVVRLKQDGSEQAVKL